MPDSHQSGLSYPDSVYPFVIATGPGPKAIAHLLPVAALPPGYSRTDYLRNKRMLRSTPSQDPGMQAHRREDASPR